MSENRLRSAKLSVVFTFFFFLAINYFIAENVGERFVDAVIFSTSMFVVAIAIFVEAQLSLLSRIYEKCVGKKWEEWEEG